MLVGSTRAEPVIEQRNKTKRRKPMKKWKKLLIDTKEEEDSIAYKIARRTDMQKSADQVK